MSQELIDQLRAARHDQQYTREQAIEAQAQLRATIDLARVNSMTLEEIGAVLELSRQRVHQLATQPVGTGRPRLPADKISNSAAWRREQRAKVRGDACEVCGASEQLVVHHPNGEPRDTRPSNRQTLCRSCHRRAHPELARAGAKARWGRVDKD